MQTIENISRSNSNSQARINNSDIREAFANYSSEEDLKKEKFNKANSIKIKHLLNYYKIEVIYPANLIICPFHKNGAETSASVKVYDDTNTCYCFACKTTWNPVTFVSSYEKISNEIAANKLIKLFDTGSYVANIKTNNSSKEYQLIIDFSDFVLNFKKTYQDDYSLLFINNVCKFYDKMCDGNLSEKAIAALNDILIKKIYNYINSLNG